MKRQESEYLTIQKFLREGKKEQTGKTINGLDVRMTAECGKQLEVTIEIGASKMYYLCDASLYTQFTNKIKTQHEEI